jgi:hypothetical protein
MPSAILAWEGRARRYLCKVIVQKSDRKILDLVCKLVGFHHFRDQVESTHAISYGCLKLVRIEDSRELNAILLAFPGLNQKMPILRKERTSQLRGAIE